MKITLEGKTNKGLKFIHRFGPNWVIHVRTDTVLFNPEKGPWLYITPAGQFHNSPEAMWIKENNDPNFKIIANEQ